jgi:hypothetical protein
MGPMSLFQPVNHIYNSPIQDLNFVMNPSIALEISKFFFCTTTQHDNNLSNVYANLF